MAIALKDTGFMTTAIRAAQSAATSAALVLDRPGRLAADSALI